MNKILLTAFEKFGNHLDNPSEILLSEINIPDNVRCLLLPVTFKESYELIENNLKKEHFDVVVMLGLANDRDFITYEKIAINHIDCTISDNNGENYHNQKIIEIGQDGIFSNFNNETLSTLEQFSKTKVKKSLSAGSFVCNYIFYKTRFYYPEIKSIFIHLPNFDKVNKDIQKEFIEYMLSIV